MLTTDGYWNDGTVATGTGGDGNNGSVITNSPVPVGDPNYKTYQYTQALPYKDSNSNTLADVAMKYWKTDLRGDLTNNVPSEYSSVAAENNAVGKDPAFWQHMVTFTISIGLKTASGLSSVSEVTAATTWAAPGDNSTNNIDDLLHAAVNGRGTFVSASSPQAFADGLEAALAKISERTASFSNGCHQLHQSQYRYADFQCELRVRSLDRPVACGKRADRRRGLEDHERGQHPDLYRPQYHYPRRYLDRRCRRQRNGWGHDLPDRAADSRLGAYRRPGQLRSHRC